VQVSRRSRRGPEDPTQEAGGHARPPRGAAIPAALGGPTAPEPALVENLLAIALLRHTERDVLERFAAPEHVFVWRSADDREIDFLVDVGRPIPLESKYASRPTGKDYESMTKAFGRGIMASRRTLDAERSILTVPAGVLLALLG
jgi:predicted AAA+ superfamily ATPase